MDIDRIAKQLEAHRSALSRDLGVERLLVFGSVVRGTGREDSDIDILVDFDGPATFDRYFELKERLEKLLGRSVDLVTRNALRPAMRPVIEREAVRVA